MNKVIFRSSLATAAAALALATLQILFDVPVAPFLVPGGGAANRELVASYAGGVQRVSAELNTVAYPSMIVQRGIPVEITFSAVSGSIDDCNEWILLPDYGIEQKLSEGENILRFLPEESGVFRIVCGLGRMNSTITVVESLGFTPPEEKAAATPPPEPSDDEAPDAGPASGTPAPTAPLARVRLVPKPAIEPSGAALSETEEPEAEPSEPVLSETASPEAAPPVTVSAETDIPVFEKEETNASIGGWIESQLVPGSEDAVSREIKSWTGWIFDRDCVGISPVKHTKMCNVMGTCYDSGLGIFAYVPGKAFDTYTAVETFLCFDGASKELAVAFLYALPDEWRNNITVTVTGYAVNNIPVADNELLVPETDVSRVDHYLNGIHATKIEAAYIDGLSTNPLPEPNVIFTQP
ncbi:MAG: hypothetical protein LBF64_04045 [Oscillospiraceae bacterium]|jgi:hypothetical protein|nr:hypothetical protein [Oscillospiraceae bacterium]